MAGAAARAEPGRRGARRSDRRAADGAPDVGGDDPNAGTEKEGARQMLAAGLLDEILVFVAPVLLGDGTRLFDHPGGTDISLERPAATSRPWSTASRYRVR